MTVQPAIFIGAFEVPQYADPTQNTAIVISSAHKLQPKPGK